MAAGIVISFFAVYAWWYYLFVMSDGKTLWGCAILTVGSAALLLLGLARKRRAKNANHEGW